MPTDRAHWLIWSNEHARWWRPARAGYTGVIEEAGRYPEQIADQICRDANFMPGVTNEVKVRAPEAPLQWPADLTQPMIDVLGMPPGPTIAFARALQASGWDIPPRFENEFAAVRHYLMPFVLAHGQDWRGPAKDDLEAKEAAWKERQNG